MSDLQKTALYLHIPFCIKKCAYCSFYKKIWCQDLEKSYLAALKKEAHYYHANFPTLSISSLFLGGGTPSCLSTHGLETLFQIIYDNFKINPHIEKSIEVNPDSVTLQKLNIFKRYQINRISLGIQSLDDQTLRYLGRIHDQRTALKAIDLIQNCGFNNLNFDLIFGIPGSNIDQLKNTLTLLLKFNPSHLSTYALSIESGTKLYRQKTTPVTNQIELKEYRFLRHFLAQHDFNHYEVSAFAKKNHRCIHNLNYWRFGSYLGLGPGAHSFFNNQRYAHKSDLNDYLLNPNPKLVTPKKNHQTKKAINEFLIFNLRLLDGFAINRLNKLFNIDFLKQYASSLQKLQNLKLIKITHQKMKVTVKGLYLLNEVLIELLR